MDSSDFCPMRIRAYFRTGIVCDPWLPLDGVLYYQAMREAYGTQDATLPGGNQQRENEERSLVPLRVDNPDSPLWSFACSWAQWSAPTVEGTDHWNKRFDNGYADYVEFGKRRGKVIIEQGGFKSYHMPVFYRSALYAEWYAVGNKRRIGELLSTATHIGKKSSQGWGRVAKWEMEEMSEDWSTWKRGYLVKGIPALFTPLPEGSTQQTINFMHYGFRPSYYRSENQTLLAVPT